MAIPAQLSYQGPSKEFQFRDQFVMPLLVRLGFGVVANNHGQREFGRDIVFGDIDRFGHVVYYGMQVKYESSISLGDSHSLAQDAEQATHNPFRHPHTGRQEYIRASMWRMLGISRMRQGTTSSAPLRDVGFEMRDC